MGGCWAQPHGFRRFEWRSGGGGGQILKPKKRGKGGLFGHWPRREHWELLREALSSSLSLQVRKYMGQAWSEAPCLKVTVGVVGTMSVDARGAAGVAPLVCCRVCVSSLRSAWRGYSWRWRLGGVEAARLSEPQWRLHQGGRRWPSLESLGKSQV